MICYDDRLQKLLKKGKIPREILVQFHNVFLSLDRTKDLGLFDIKALKEENNTNQRTYYRLRKGKYRTIFYQNNEDYFIISLGKREEVYKKWL